MKILCKNKHWKMNEEYDINKILYLLIDRPNYINPSNDFIWENNKGEYHRKYDFPAIVHCDGYVEWCKNGQDHRNDNKPAVIWSDDGFKECWVNGNFVKEIK